MPTPTRPDQHHLHLHSSLSLPTSSNTTTANIINTNTSSSSTATTNATNNNIVMAQVTTAIPVSSNTQVLPTSATALFPTVMPSSFHHHHQHHLLHHHPHQQTQLPVSNPQPTTTTTSITPNIGGGADTSVLSACRTLVVVLTDGGHTLLSVELERTVLWKSRQSVERTAAAWHATHGLLSLLSRESGDTTLRHNLSTFARCVDVLGYRVREFAIAHHSAPHLKLLWRPHLNSSTAAAAPSGTFSTSERFAPVTSHPIPPPNQSQTMIFIHRDAISTSFARPRPSSSSHSPNDTFTYVLSRNVRAVSGGWGEQFGSNQPATSATTSAPQSHLQTSATIAAMNQLGMQPSGSNVAAAAAAVFSNPSHQPSPQPQQQSHLGEQPITHPFAPDIPVQCIYSQPMPLPPMRGQSSSLPPVRELEARQKQQQQQQQHHHYQHQQQQQPQSSNMMTLGFTTPMHHSLPNVQPIAATPIDSRIPSSHDSLFGEVQMSHSLLPVAASQWNTAMHAPPPPAAAPGTSAMSTTTGLQTLPIHSVTRTRQSSRSVAASQRSCTNCSTSVTRQWVRGERSAWLCHSCGQFWRKNGYHRPAGLWNRPTFKRSRRKRTGTGAASISATAARSTAPAPVSTPVTSTPITYPAPTSSIGLAPVIDPLFREPGSSSGGGDA